MGAPHPRSYVPISDYGLIGDCHGTALVSRQGSIDWLCLHRFDAGGVFCSLLDRERGGAFALNPRQVVGLERRYLPDTTVLETTFITRTGRAHVVDFLVMRPGGRTHPLNQLIRIVTGVQGTVQFEAVLMPRFDYGSLRPWLRYHPSERVYSATGGNDAIVVSTDCVLEHDVAQTAWTTDFTLLAGQQRWFVLTAALPSRLDLRHVTGVVVRQRLNTTVQWWARWTRKCTYDGPFRHAVVRSALTLKLLTCSPTGAIIAAPTTSLPEVMGGTRNWDYRYCWIRDASMTLHALLAVGHTKVADSFRRFIESATAGHARDLQILYGCYGERRLPESSIDNLRGYRGSHPVRVGNGATRQTQLDVYGSLLDAAHVWSAVRDAPPEMRRLIRGMVEEAVRRWKEKDRGIWEMRGAPRHFVYSKAMCWLAIRRGVQLLQDAPEVRHDLARWRRTAETIRRSIERHGVDPRRGCFVQAYGSTDLDASLLRLPLIGFVSADDPRMIATVEAIRKKLSEGPLLRRYDNRAGGDGFPGREGAFLLASFWLVDVLTMQGRLDEAGAQFARLLDYGNDLGLFSEEYDLKRHQALGNFPQAYTHVALITAAEQLRQAATPGFKPCEVAARLRPRHVSTSHRLRAGAHHGHHASV